MEMCTMHTVYPEQTAFPILSMRLNGGWIGLIVWIPRKAKCTIKLQTTEITKALNYPRKTI